MREIENPASHWKLAGKEWLVTDYFLTYGSWSTLPSTPSVETPLVFGNPLGSFT